MIFQAPSGTHGANVLSRRLELTRTVLRFVMVALFFLAGSRHLTITSDFVGMIPPWVPMPHAMVIFTGWCELFGATGLLIPRLRRLAGVMLAIFLVCVYPATIYEATAHIPFHGHATSWAFEIPHLALQPILVWWALFCSAVINWPFASHQTRKDIIFGNLD